MLSLLLTISNVTNGNVLDNLITHMGGMPGIFGPNLFGIILLILIIGVLLFTKASLDIGAAVMIPCVFLLSTYGLLPMGLAIITLLAGGAILALVFYRVIGGR